ncbi:FliM/FliN family flagellar motor switch protein [Sphingomonas sp. DT-51]|uniref:FliM/FliN family flagellar motor switch protein n=1 Tax=Sphingomonas sp. DT-51 TaxID=3396165 RepID=UPI003F1B5D43
MVEAAGEEGLTFRVGITRDAGAGPWLVGADGVALRIDTLEGREASLHPERVEAAVAALDQVEPLLDLIEASTGLVIEPDSAIGTPAGDAIMISVAAFRDEIAVAELAIAIPPTLVAAMPVDTARLAARSGSVPVAGSLSATAVLLTVEEAGALAVGDLVVLAGGAWRGVLDVGTIGQWRVRFDPANGRAVADEGEPMGMDVPADGEVLRAFRVPLELRVEGAAATLGELAALREGGALALGPLDEGLRVTLCVGGRVLGRGEIVQLGDRFAVVVEQLAQPPRSTAEVKPETAER